MRGPNWLPGATMRPGRMITPTPSAAPSPIQAPSLSRWLSMTVSPMWTVTVAPSRRWLLVRTSAPR
jgi:hypothetical protein